MKMFTLRPENKRTSRRWLLLIPAVIALLVIGSMLAGIVANMVDRSENYATDQTTADYYGGKSVSAPMPTQAPASSSSNSSLASGGVAAAKPGQSTVSTGSTAYNLPDSSLDRMVIRSANLSLVSEDVEKTLSQVRSLVIAQNGIVSSSNTTVRGDYTYATIAIQVPSQSYDDTMNQLRKVAYKVESETSNSQDVTEEYADVDSQVRNLKATEAQLLDLMKKATTLNDTLTIQRELTSIRGQIEQREGRMNFLSKKSAVSTISISISPKLPVSTTKPSSDWDFGTVVDRAWSGSLRGLQVLATVATNIVVYGIWIVPLLALLGFLVMWLFRKLFPPRRNNGPVVPPSAGDAGEQGAAA